MMTAGYLQQGVVLLKRDLLISNPSSDPYLWQLILAACEYIKAEGIDLVETPGDLQLVVMYAAYLYRRRREENAVMPRMLRYALNNRAIGGDANG